MEYKYDDGWHVHKMNTSSEMKEIFGDDITDQPKVEVAYSLDLNCIDIRTCNMHGEGVEGWTVALFSERGARIQDYLIAVRANSKP